MAEEMYFKYVKFLNEHKLYDKQTFEYINNHSVLVNYKKIDEYNSLGCSVVVDKSGKLVEVIPVVPFLKNDKMVAINIFVYIQAMMLIPNIGRKYDERYYNKVLPIIFLDLYISENKNRQLLEFEKELILKMFNQSKEQYDNAINYKDFLVNSYKENEENINKKARVIRRKAKEYIKNKELLRNIDNLS